MFCWKCKDVVKLDRRHRTCKCGFIYGKYKRDGVNAVINEHAIPLGIYNPSIKEAIEDRSEDGLGSRFEAFVIPKIWPTIEVINYKG